MALRVQVVVDCRDPDRLAEFWAAALGYEKQWTWDDATTTEMLTGGLAPDRVNSRCAVIDPVGAGPRIFFQRVPEEKRTKNRLHLDVAVGADRLDEEVERLSQLGAVRTRGVEEQFGPFPLERWTVMHDPEGNEFCVVAG